MRQFSETEFLDLNYKVMGHCFAIQNRYGNLLDEVDYRRELACRLAAEDFEVMQEVGFTLEYGNFRRRYPCDLLLERGIIYETKTQSEITPSHKRQLLHYLLLSDIPRGAVLNFRPPSMDSWIMKNSGTSEMRRCPSIDLNAWANTDTSDRLRDCMRAMIGDWGTGLSRICYFQSLFANLGLHRPTITPVALHDNQRRIGTKNLPIFPDNSGLILTSYPKILPYCAPNIQRLLQLTTLNHIHWINLSIDNLTFTTIPRS